MSGRRQRWTFHLSGGRLCLDLANTVSWRRSAAPIERLPDYGDLLAWSLQTGVLRDGEAAALRREAARHPDRAASALRQAWALREGIYRLFGALSKGRTPAAADLAELNVAVVQAFRHRRLAQVNGEFAWEWNSRQEPLCRPLWPVAWSAAEVLVSDDLRRVRTCPASNCGWIFLDRTKNGARRWCDMRVCGNRAKAQRYYVRHRPART